MTSPQASIGDELYDVRLRIAQRGAFLETQCASLIPISSSLVERYCGSGAGKRHEIPKCLCSRTGAHFCQMCDIVRSLLGRKGDRSMAAAIGRPAAVGSSIEELYVPAGIPLAKHSTRALLP